MSIPESEQYDLLDRLAEEFAARFRRGERPAIKEYTDRYTDLADEIRELFPALVKVEQAEGLRQAEEHTHHSPVTNPPPSQVGDYRIVREIGRGGMGVVYEAEQISLGRRVALKVLPWRASTDRMVLERFRREARATARLHHTNIVPVYEVGQDGDVRFYAMQLIQGQGLDLVIAELRRHRSPAGPESKTMAASIDESVRSGPEHSRGVTDDPTLDAEAEVSPVLRSILTGRFDVGGPPPKRGEASRLGLAAARAAGVAPSEVPEAKRRAAPSDPALARTEAESARAGDPDGPELEYRLAPGSSWSASPSSSSAILPGGSQLSSVDSGRRRFFHSLAQIGRQVAGGLAYAHARGIVHRDIKPSNLLLDTEGVVWITDFGLAKADDDGLTQTGDILGTLRYMAPERFRGEGDARADIYALGLTLYELLTLRSSFKSADRLELIERIKTEEPQQPRSLDGRIPRDLETIVLKAIEKDPKARYQSAAAMGEDLRRFLADEPIRARQVSAAERYWRWARRNPAIAVLGGVLTAVLVLATVSSLLAAGYFNQSAQSERAARQEADLLRQAESSQRKRAEMEKKRADVTLADMYTSRGLLAGERDAPAEAVLWFAAAAEQSASAEDSRRHANNRLRARNWIRQAIVPVAAMSSPTYVDQLEFQPRAHLLLVRHRNSAVIIWSWRDGKQLPWAETLSGVCSAQFSPDGASVALGFLSSLVQIRNVQSGELLAQIRHQGQIKALAFSPDGRFLAIASQGARVWDIRRQAFHTPVWNHPRPVSAVAFNRNGDRLITACEDKLARVFAVESGPDRTEPLYAPIVHIRAFSTCTDRRRPYSCHSQRRFGTHALGIGNRRACCEPDPYQADGPSGGCVLSRWQLVCHGWLLWSGTLQGGWQAASGAPGPHEHGHEICFQPRQYDAALRKLRSDSPALVDSPRSADWPATEAHGNRARMCLVRRREVPGDGAV